MAMKEVESYAGGIRNNRACQSGSLTGGSFFGGNMKINRIKPEKRRNKMGSLLPVIIQLVSGAVGGNVAGSLMKKNSLGTLLNSVVGIIGGGLGGQLLGMLGMGTAAGGMDLAGILASVAGGGVGGGVLLAIIGLIKKAMAPKK
jgi:uncharacterized membrane protein YeaQ/YmgE (transglycosylase-associated protein family)